MTVLDILNKINIISFKYKKDSPIQSDKTYFGVSAQQLAKLFPTTDYSIVKPDDKGLLTVDYSQLSCLFALQIKNQEIRIKELEDKISNLEKLIKEKS